MISKFKQLFKDSIIYGLGGAISSIVGVLLTPFYTRIFQPSDYGIIELISATTSFLSIVLIMGFDTAIGLLFFKTKDEQDKHQTLSTGFVAIFTVTIIVCGTLYYFARPISFMLLKSDYSTLLRINFITIPVLIIVTMVLELLRLKFKSTLYSFINIGKGLLTIGLTLILVIILKHRLNGVFSAILYTHIIFAIVCAILIKKYMRWDYSTQKLKNLFKIGLPLIPAGIAAWVMNLLDRYFLVHYSTLSEVGLYSIAVRISSILTLLVSAFQLAWGPYALSVMYHEDAKDFYAKILLYYTITSSLVAIGLALFAKEIILILAPSSYLGAYSIVGILALGIVAYGAYYIVAIGVNIAQKTYLIAITTIVAAISNIILNFLLIPSFGKLGASIATLISYFISTYFLYRYSQKHYPIQYDFKRITSVLFVTSLIIFLGIGVNKLSLWYGIGAKFLLLTLFFLAIWFFNIFTNTEKRYIKSWCLKYFPIKNI